MIEIWNGTTDLRPLAESWATEWKGDCDIEQGIRDLTLMKEDPNSDVLVLNIDMDDDTKKLIGVMGIQVLDMFFTQDCYSAVRYWYILPKYRYNADNLIRHARKWSQEKACTKMMICENKLSVPCADFYKAMGFREFETVFIGDL